MSSAEQPCPAPDTCSRWTSSSSSPTRSTSRHGSLSDCGWPCCSRRAVGASYAWRKRSRSGAASHASRWLRVLPGPHRLHVGFHVCRTAGNDVPPLGAASLGDWPAQRVTSAGRRPFWSRDCTDGWRQSCRHHGRTSHTGVLATYATSGTTASVSDLVVVGRSGDGLLLVDRPTIFLSKYAFNYLPYTETSQLTTSTTSAYESLRGASFWVNYFNLNGPLIRGVWILVSSSVAILGTSLGHQRSGWPA